VGEASGCVIAVPQQTIQSPVAGTAPCEAHVDVAKVDVRNGQKMLTVVGWAASGTLPVAVPEHVFVSFAAAGVPPTYYDTLKVSRPDVNEHLKISETSYAGFTRLVPGDWAPGVYQLGVVQYGSGRYQACPFNKQVVVQ